MLTDVPARTDLPPQPTRAFPLVRVPTLEAVRAFYVDRLGCPMTHDLPNYLQVQLTALGPEGPELCFMIDPEHPGGKNPQPVILSVPVPDADAVQAALRAADVTIAAPAADRPWGWRSLHVVDPTGLVLDLFHVLGDTPGGATS